MAECLCPHRPLRSPLKCMTLSRPQFPDQTRPRTASIIIRETVARPALLPPPGRTASYTVILCATIPLHLPLARPRDAVAEAPQYPTTTWLAPWPISPTPGRRRRGGSASRPNSAAATSFGMGTRGSKMLCPSPTRRAARFHCWSEVCFFPFVLPHRALYLPSHSSSNNAHH